MGPRAVAQTPGGLDIHLRAGMTVTGAVGTVYSIGVPVETGPNPIAPPNPSLVKLPFSFPTAMENTPVVFNGRSLLVDNHRPGGFKAKGEDCAWRVSVSNSSGESEPVLKPAGNLPPVLQILVD